MTDPQRLSSFVDQLWGDEITPSLGQGINHQRQRR